MRQIVKLLLVLFLFSGSIRIDAQMNMIWETGEDFKAPESVVYDQKRDVLYVSNYTKRTNDGVSYEDCSISKVDRNGKIIKYDWIPNLTSPTGICIFKDMLYIVERFGIVEYDLNLDKVNNRFFISQASFINDVTVDADTNIYVTDSGGKAIYRINEVDGQYIDLLS